MTDTVKIEDFITANRITMTAERVDCNPHMDSRDMDHWKVEFRRVPGGKTVARLTTYYSMGFGHNGKAPKAERVLNCLASDASGSTGSFEYFCGDSGYDTDSRKAEKIYKACRHSAARLRKFLGDDLYQVLLYGVERL